MNMQVTESKRRIVNHSNDEQQQQKRVEDLASNVSCAICQSEISATDQSSYTFGCGHIFHRACIEPWLLQQRRERTS